MLRSLTTTDNLMPVVTPGEILREEFMKPMRPTGNALAEDLHVPPNRIAAILNGSRSITADTALRLSRYFGTTPEFWMNLQQGYELDVAKRAKLKQIIEEVAVHTR